MSENKNFHKVDGTIHSKPVKSGTSKAGKEYSIPSLVLEIDDSWTGRDNKYHEGSVLVEFRLTKNVAEFIDSYDIGDTVTVNFKLAGREFKGNIYNEPTCFKLEHAELDAKRPTHKGKVQVDSAPPKKQVPVAPEEDDLPF